ncbi:unnamed protein product [Trichogramma brassicae]|uniref:Endonuclease/exonuclease/phosphatase domain-containing protein n=1 Tax=Trichogramma brassicae TaxID=86971 RepID=A0A6H5IQ04_9HYME|nr:unnamed protein product [Trichogramma brassicae]
MRLNVHSLSTKSIVQRCTSAQADSHQMCALYRGHTIDLKKMFRAFGDPHLVWSPFTEETFTVVKGRRGWHRDPHQAEEVKRGLQPLRPRQRKVHLRLDAIVVKSAGTTTYADILRRLYAEPALQETVGKSVQCIRRSASGAMVLQLRKGMQSASTPGTEPPLAHLAIRPRPRSGTSMSAQPRKRSARLFVTSWAQPTWIKMCQTVRELGINVAIVCDQYKILGPHYEWIADSNRQAAIWVRGGLPVQDRPSRPLPFFTCARVSNVYIFSVYASPRLSNAEFSALLTNVGEEAQGKRPLITAGDFNVWSTEWGSSKTKLRGVIFLDALSALDVVLLNTGHTPTFTGPQGSTIIDLSFASDSLTPRMTGWRVERGVFTNSDHRPITFNLSVHRSSAGPRRRWSARTLDKEAFSERLSSVRIPHATPSTRRTWWLPSSPPLPKPAACRYPAGARGRAMEDARLADFAIAKGQLRATIDESKRRCWSALCDEVDRDAWGRPYIAVMSHLRGPRTMLPREPSLVQRTVATLFPTVTEALIRPPARPAGAVIPGVTLGELRGAYTRIQDGAAPGLDGVPNRALKLAVALRPDAFLQVYSACLSGDVFPSPWKRQRLVLLSKAGRPPDAPSSYRPLCMLNMAGKILKRIICRRLELYTEVLDGFSDHQHGFRRGRSTIDAIESVTAAREVVGGAVGVLSRRHRRRSKRIQLGAVEYYPRRARANSHARVPAEDHLQLLSSQSAGI